MSPLRRRFLHLAGGLAALSITSHFAKAEAFPRTIHIVVAFPPGGVGDISARLIAQPLQQRLVNLSSSTTAPARVAMSGPKPWPRRGPTAAR